MDEQGKKRRMEGHPGSRSHRARGGVDTVLVGILGLALAAGCRTVREDGLPLGKEEAQATGSADAGSEAPEPDADVGTDTDTDSERADLGQHGATPPDSAEPPNPSDSCEAGQRFCAGNIPQICGADGTWILAEPCAFACQDGCVNQFAAISSGRGSPTDGNGRAAFVFNDQTFFSGGGGLLGARGFNVAVLDPKTGRELEPVRTFDPWDLRISGRALDDFADYLEALEPGRLLLLAVSDDAGLTEIDSCRLRDLDAVRRVVTALERMGSTQIGSYCFRSAWAFVTLTGAPTPLQEKLSPGSKVTAEVRLPADP